ncbi:hypothetical protein NQZ68_036367 [Dissostichus eleginoides]|nr:hypothetical protein NQZ68_036367 [Dissostichus eleginoides]
MFPNRPGTPPDVMSVSEPTRSRRSLLHTENLQSLGLESSGSWITAQRRAAERRQMSIISVVASIRGITFQHEAFEKLPVEILSRTRTPS